MQWHRIYSEAPINFVMTLEFGCSNRGKPTVIYRNFEYVKDCDNVCGTTSWRCRLYQQMKCEARLVTSGNRVVSNRQPEHTQTDNVAIALAREAVGEMKQAVGTMNVTSRSAHQTSVSAALSDDVLMALRKRPTLSKVLQRQRHKVAKAAHGGNAFPPIPPDRTFAITDHFVIADVIRGWYYYTLQDCKPLCCSHSWWHSHSSRPPYSCESPVQVQEHQRKYNSIQELILCEHYTSMEQSTGRG